jgi:transcriptional regulator GlxA family with amidase domain
MTWMLRRPPGGRELAQQVSDLLISHQRNPDETQSLPLRYRYANLPESLLDALEIMESNVEEPLSASEIADYLKISRRQLERQFCEYLDTAPARKYLEIRLARARLSVLRTNRKIEEIAMSCGFKTTAHFIERYRAVYSNTPQSERLSAVRSGKGSDPI